MEFSRLTEEQKAKARECSTADELTALAGEPGEELSGEQLETVSGGDGEDGSSPFFVDGENKCPPFFADGENSCRPFFIDGCPGFQGSAQDR